MTMFEVSGHTPVVRGNRTRVHQFEQKKKVKEDTGKKTAGYLGYNCFQGFCEKYLILNNAPLSLDMMPHMRFVYDSLQRDDAVVLQAGRQVAKSSTLANFILYLSSAYHNHNTLFVTPAQMQTVQFSTDRLKPLINHSPTFKAAMTDRKCVDKVLQQSFVNQSMCHLRFAYLNADRIRGISADTLIADEIQDILLDNLPVIEEVLSFKDMKNKPFGKRRVYSGTPKSTSSALNHYWSQSTQNEWVVKCFCKSTFTMATGNAIETSNTEGINIILDDEIVQPNGFKCKNCGKELQRFNTKRYYNKSGKPTAIARWNVMNPGARWTGYRISQLQVKWIPIKEIIEKKENYTTAKYYNEVLGIAYDSGTKPITKFELMQCCNDQRNLISPLPQHKQMPIFMGIDWGQGTGLGFTVVTIATVVNGKDFKVLGVKKMMGSEADIARQVPIISNMINEWNTTLTCADWGFGADKNLRLREYFGLSRIMECQYVGSQKKMVNYDKETYRYMTDRTQMMDVMFHLMKTKQIEFPKWDDFEFFAEDITNIDAEYNEKTFRTKFIHKPGQPDDSFHSILYAYMAFCVAMKKPL